MASRLLKQFQYSLEDRVTSIFANIPIGAAGAVGTLDPVKNQGILSVTRNSTGKYTIVLGASSLSKIDYYKRLLSLDVTVLQSGIPTTLNVSVDTDSVASAGSVVIQFSGPTNASTTTPIAADPNSGAVLLLHIRVKG